MRKKVLKEQDIANFCSYLMQDEKSCATVEKYARDVKVFFVYANGRTLSRDLVRDWKEYLLATKYASSSVNSMLSSLSSLLKFLGWEECRANNLRLQKSAYRSQEKELTREEYLRLLKAASDQPQLRLIMETICGTGIRVSELQHFTLESVYTGEIEVRCKGKIRTILLQGKLRRKILNYARENNIESGVVFLSKKGTPLDRSYIWRKMKKLCEMAKVDPEKVFPHNLRKLFARTFYEIGKDIAKLADVLGHSSINTTRIYIMGTGREHRKLLDRLGLVV